MDTVRKVLLGPQLYELCSQKKATLNHLEERVQLLSKKIGTNCSVKDLVDMCDLKSSSDVCTNSGDNKGVMTLNSILENQTECSICFEELDETYKTFGYCGHMFHKDCLDKWNSSPGIKNPGCPMCRGPPLPTMPKKANCQSFEYNPSMYICSASAEGRLDCVKEGLDKGYKLDECSVAFSAENGHFDIVKYLVEKGAKIDSLSLIHSVRKGHMDILKYLIEHGGECNVKVLETAASSNKLEMLKYLHDRGCQWNEKVATAAAKNGNLTILKYLHESGCPWNYDTLLFSLIHDKLNTFIYAVENGCDGVETLLEANKIIFEDRPEFLKYLKSKGWKKSIFSNKWSLSRS